MASASDLVAVHDAATSAGSAATAPLPRRPLDLLDGGVSAVAARLPTTAIGLDQLWRTARRRARRAFAASADARRLDLARLAPAELRSGATRAAIVASGPSARMVDLPEWAASLADMDVFALNHAAAIAPHPLLCSIEVPDLVGRQAGLRPDQGVAFLEWAVASARATTPSTTVVVRANRFDGPTMALARRVDVGDGRTHVALQAGLSVRGATGSDRFARWAASRDALRWPAPAQPFVCARGGLGFLVALTIALGYAEVVLFGVDLSSSAYFFDELDDTTLPGITPFTQALGPVAPVPHSTAVARRDRPGIVDALAALDTRVLRPRGARLTVASERSWLHPALALATPEGR